MPTQYKGVTIPEYTDSEDGPQLARWLIDGLQGGGFSTGTLANRPTSPSSTTLYIVVGDTTPANNGRAFVYAASAWNEIGLKVVTGTLANRPTTFVGNRIYIVVGDGTATNNGLTYYDTGTAWLQIGGGGSTVRAVASSPTNVPVRSTGVASQTGNYYEAVDSDGAIRFAVKSTGRVLTPVENQAFTYNSDGTLASATVTIGGATVRTFTPTYNSDGTLNTTSDMHDGVTDASTYAYTTVNGTSLPSAITRTRS